MSRTRTPEAIVIAVEDHSEAMAENEACPFMTDLENAKAAAQAARGTAVIYHWATRVCDETWRPAHASARPSPRNVRAEAEAAFKRRPVLTLKRGGCGDV